MASGSINTPRFVLKDGLLFVGPHLQDSQGAYLTAIYGFSDKPEYDRFKSQCDSRLTPYPLVKRYLETQLESNDESLKLVVLDAASSDSQILYAATFQAVLLTLQNNESFVKISHQLINDANNSLYRIEAFQDDESSDSVSPSQGNINQYDPASHVLQEYWRE